MDGNVARRVLETRLRELEQRARLEGFRLKALTDEGFHIVYSGFCDEGDEIPCYVKFGDSLD